MLEYSIIYFHLISALSHSGRHDISWHTPTCAEARWNYRIAAGRLELCAFSRESLFCFISAAEICRNSGDVDDKICSPFRPPPLLTALASRSPGHLRGPPDAATLHHGGLTFYISCLRFRRRGEHRQIHISANEKYWCIITVDDMPKAAEIPARRELPMNTKFLKYFDAKERWNIRQHTMRCCRSTAIKMKKRRHHYHAYNGILLIIFNIWWASVKTMHTMLFSKTLLYHLHIVPNTCSTGRRARLARRMIGIIAFT